MNGELLLQTLFGSDELDIRISPNGYNASEDEVTYVGTVKSPDPYRRAIISASQSPGQNQLAPLLDNLYKALTLPTDVSRFLCLHAHEQHPSNVEKCVLQHDSLVLALIKIYDSHRELDETYDIVAFAALKALGRVFSAGVSVANVKKILRRAAMAKERGCRRDVQHEWRLLQVLTIAGRDHLTVDYEASKVEGKKRTLSHRLSGYFGFGGRGSGLRMSAVSKWPFTNEYGLWCWFRMEEHCGRFELLSMHTASGGGGQGQGLGVEFSLVGDDLIGYNLIARASDERGRSETRIKIGATVLCSQTWNHILICHAPRRFPFGLGLGTLKVVVNGQDVSSANEKADAFQLYFPTKIKSALTQVRLMKDFDGQTGPIFMFQEPVSLAHVNSLAKLYLRPRGGQSTGKSVTGVSGLEVGEVDKTLELKVFACFHPFHCVRDLAMDLYSGHHALLEPNTCPWTLPSVQDALEGAGGVKALIPFLWHSEDDAEEEGQPLGGYCIVEAVRILTIAIESYMHAATAFADLDAPALISSALEQASPKILSAVAGPLLFAIDGLINAAGHWRKSQGVFASPRKISAAVEVALYKRLMLNFSLWAQCDTDALLCCEKLFHILHKRITLMPGLFRSKLGVLNVIDPLRKLFMRFLVEDETLDPKREALCDSYAKHAQRIICAMLSEEVQPSELNALLCPVIGVSGRLEAQVGRSFDEEASVNEDTKWDEWSVKLCEVMLKTLEQLLTTSPPPRLLFNSAASMADGYGLPVVLIGVTLKAPSHAIKLLSLRLIAAYLLRVDEASRSRPKVDTSSSVEGESGVSEVGDMLEEGDVNTAAMTMDDIAVGGIGEYSAGILKIRHSTSLQSSSLAATSLSSIGGFASMFFELEGAISLLGGDESRDVYEAIVAMFLRKTGSNEEQKAEGHDVEDFAACEAMDDSQLISNTDGLWLLLKLLPYMELGVIQHALQVLFLVLRYQKSNMRAMLQVPRWQHLLVATLRHLERPALASRTCYEVTVKLIVSVLTHLFLNATQGWRQIEVLLSIRVDDQDVLISKTLTAFFASLDSQLTAGQMQLTKLLVGNLAQTMGVVASYLLALPISPRELEDDHPHVLLLSGVIRLVHTMVIRHDQVRQLLQADRLMYCPADVALVHLLLLSVRRAGVDALALQLFATSLPLLDANGSHEIAESRSRCLLAVEAFLVALNALGDDWSNAALEQLLNSRKHDLVKRVSVLELNGEVADVLREAVTELEKREKGSHREDLLSEVEVKHLVTYFHDSMKSQKSVQERVESRQAALRRKRMDVLQFHARVVESNLGNKEMERESSSRVKERRCERDCVFKWQKLVTEGANESSVWGGCEERDEQFWMLSDKEDKLRRRLLLCRNYHYDNHAKAAWDNDSPETGEALLERSRVRRRSGRFLQGLEEWATLDSVSDVQGEGHYALQEGEVLKHVSENTQWITPLQVMRGRIEISSQCIYFYPTERKLVRHAPAHASPSKEDDCVRSAKSGLLFTQDKMGMMKWKLEEVVEIHGRRYLLRPSALELFFSNLTNIFLCFASPEDCQSCYNAILKQSTPRLEKVFRTIPTAKQVFELSDVMEKWRRREVSNFEYIMRLNTIAGRSMNDLTQYPVFPWILADYTSPRLDFSRETVFRDLSKPIGALNPARLNKEFIPKYKLLEDAGGFPPPHHYGSHYSLPGSIMQYMLRVEPFTTLHIDLQSGKFDSPDRLFFSLASTWKGCNDNPQDLKELIPEFFYFPELFINTNKLNLGLRSNDEVIDDVKLPPWASSPHEFVRLNREALESEYVSQNLHHWIDLIFGYKQRGESAKEAFNVFYYVTYEGMVDLDSIQDPVQRAAMEDQINLYGQTPSQLLLEPHPPRHAPEKCPRTFMDQVRSNGFTLHTHALWTDPASYSKPRVSSISSMLPPFMSQNSSDRIVVTGSGTPSLLYVCPFEDRVVTIFEDLSFGVHRMISPQVIKSGQIKQLPSAPISLSLRAHPHDRHLLNSAIASDMTVTSSAFACAKSGKLLLSSLYFDCSVRAHHVDSLRVEDGAVGHVDVVTCLALDEDGCTLVSGGRDCAIVVWNVVGSNDVRDETLDILGTPDLSPRRNSSGGSSKSFLVDLGLSTDNHILSFARRICAHDAPITTLVVSGNLGIIVSGASNGKVFIHQLHDGSFVRSLFIDSDASLPISQIMFAPISGNIVTILDNTHVYVFSVNGYLLTKQTFAKTVTASCVIYKNSGKECLAVGHADGLIALYRVHDFVLLEEIKAGMEYGQIEYLAMGKDNCTLFAASKCGRLHTIVPS